MDKYEFNIKLEQIKKLAAKKEYKQAAAIAREMNWNKVKDWPTLATVINVQEAAGDYEEARDMAILAYNRNLGGRKLIYKLTEFFIKVNDFENAEELYNEYAKMSAHDVNKYILYYDLRRAQGAPDTELVKILEEYKESEIDEKYMYELAKLYYKTGRREDCIKTCDNLVLWFQDGIYVENAVKLKEKLGVNLSNTQKQILKEINARKSDEEANKEKLFMEQKELARLKKDDVGDVLAEDDSEVTSQAAAVDTKAADRKTEQGINSNVVNNEKATDDKSETKIEESTDVSKEAKSEEKPESKVQAVQQPENDDKAEKDGGVSIDLVQNNQNMALKESIVKAIERQNEAKKETADAISKDISNAGDASMTETDNQTVKSESDTSFSDNITKATLSLKELIENAKKNIENSCEKISREDEEEARRAAQKRIDEKAEAMDIEVSVPNYNLYDTHNLQEELANNVKDLIKDDQDETFRPPFERKNTKTQADSADRDALAASQEVTVKNAGLDQSVENQEYAGEDEQIEGQLSIMDWMESVREEKYGKQDTREFSKAELERMLDEKDEKSEAYERIIAKKKEEALNKGAEFDEAEAKRAAEAEITLDSVKRDLAMRTGKAAFILEQDTARELKNAEKYSQPEAGTSDKAAVSDKHSTDINVEVSASGTNTQNNVAEELQSEADVNESESKADVNEELTLNTTQFNPVTDEVLKEYKQNTSDNSSSVDNNMSNMAIQQEETAAADSTSDIYSVKADKNENQVTDIDEQPEKKLSGELAKIFRKYREMPGH